jgi:hypothetical protein
MLQSIYIEACSKQDNNFERSNLIFRQTERLTDMKIKRILFLSQSCSCFCSIVLRRSTIEKLIALLVGRRIEDWPLVVFLARSI